MTKKTVLAYITLACCILLLGASYFQWKNKLSSFHGETLPVKSIEKNKDEEDETTEAAPVEDEREKLLSLIAHQDDKVQDLFLKRFDEEKPVNFLIVGSNELEAGQPGYGERLANALKKNYGNLLETEVVSYEGNIAQFMNEADAVINFDAGYDVILLEPWTLQNSGNVAIEDEQIYLNRLMDQFTASVEDAVIVLHPAQPVQQATFYPDRVNTLQTFAETNGMPYINHWAEWPDYNSEDFLTYVDGDGHPNNEGADVWASTLIDYFIANQLEEEEDE